MDSYPHDFTVVASYRDVETAERASEVLDLNDVVHFLDSGEVRAHRGQHETASAALYNQLDGGLGYIAAD